MANINSLKRSYKKAKPSITLTCVIVLLFGLFNISAQLDSYDYKKELTIDKSMVSGSDSLTDFPVLVQVTDTDLKSTSNGGSVESVNGYDIKFTASDNSTVLDHQIESYDPATGELTAWVQVPTLSADSNTTLYLYYGNSNVTSSQSTDSTWSSDYLGVWHMNGNVDDQSGNSRHFTNNGSSVATGKIGNAKSFDGSDDYLLDDDAENYLNGLSSFSISVWVKSDVTNEDRDILYGNTAGDGRDRFLGFRYDKDGAVCGGSSTIKAGIQTTQTSEYNEELGSTIQTSNWQHIVVQWQSGGAIEYYIDGSSTSISCQASSAGGDLAGLNQLLVGVGAKNQHWDGKIDELRINNAKHSSNWIKTEYNNQNNPSQYITLGNQTDNIDDSNPATDPSYYSDGKTITIQSSKVCGSGTYSDFPVLIDIERSYLKSTANGGSVENSNGYDIMFTKKDFTQLTHQIEHYDPSTGELTAWVRMPTISADSNKQFYMYYGNDSVSTSLEHDSTWSSEYQGVWHMDNVDDQTGNSRDLSDNGTSSATGVIGNGRSFDGSDDYLVDQDANNYLNGLSDISISVWVKSNVTNQDRDILFGKDAGNEHDSYLGFRYDKDGVDCGGTSSIKGGIRTTNVSEYNEELNSNKQTTDWQQIVMQWTSGGSLEFYLDGSLASVKCNASSASGSLKDISQLLVGLGTKNKHWDGKIDELRIQNSTRSADWICTQYNNQSSPSYFYTISDSVTIPCDNVNTGYWSDSTTWAGDCSGNGDVPSSEDSVEIANGNDVHVNSTQSVKSLTITGDDNDTTSLHLEEDADLTVTDSLIIQMGCGSNDVDVYIDDSARLDVQGHMLVDHKGGEDMNLKLNSKSGNKAELNVAGNTYFNLLSGCGDDINLNSDGSNGKVAIEGDMILDNENTSSGQKIDIVMQNSSVLDIEGNLEFRPSGDDNTAITLKNSSSMELAGDMIRPSSPDRYGSIKTNSDAKILLDGSSKQQLAGSVGDGSDSIRYSKLEVNNDGASFPQITTDGNVTVSNELALKDGNIKTDGDTLSLTNTSASSLTDYGAESHIVGYFKRHITSNTSEYVFPVGEGQDSTYYQAAIVNRNMSSVSWIVTKFMPNLKRHSDSLLNLDNGEFTYNSVCEEGMWLIEPDQQPSGADMYDLKLWIDNISGLTDNLFGIIKRPKGSSTSDWSQAGTLNSPGGKGRVTEDGYALSKFCTSFSEAGTGDGDGTSQPIELIEFNAEAREDKVDLKWTTAVEIDNDYFTIQRSTNGQDWHNLQTVEGAGNSSSKQNYHAVDQNPKEGVSYYRIKQTDFNGEHSHTGIETVNYKTSSEGFLKVYPNPNEGIFTLEIRSSASSLQMNLFNLNGELLYQKQLGSSTGHYKNRYNFDAKLSDGMYFVRIQTANGQSYTEKIEVND